MSLNEKDKEELLRLINVGMPLPESWRGRLFPDSARQQEIGKEYRLVYDGKARREEKYCRKCKVIVDVDPVNLM